ncbi:MacB family efflux pump subunit [Moraxella nasovis]|uniref:MacB family efflux pump subunit n=1 Tax=Moraxella nasovis TaxID=2904121 RepID=UPI001F625263|nr:MacB family efflux pump subunit [Moraxella nasovis]UNU72920.1 MacB family efflux pump subunit [Moraxella nasovis]
MTIPHNTNDQNSHAKHKIPLLEIQNLVKEFVAGDNTIRILHGIDLTLYQGEMVAIIGQSGSGKSTLMNILGCLDKATSGDYTIFGKSVNEMNTSELAKLRREHFGFIFQRYHLLGDINALDNVSIPAVYAGMDSTKRRKRATNLLTQLGLGDKTQNRPNQLSGGQQQRVSIARALMNGGDIILADEPTGALDSGSGNEVMSILHNLKDKGHTIIMVTHDPNLAKQAERVIELKDGRIIADYYINHAHNQHTNPTNLTDFTNPNDTDDINAQGFNTQTAISKNTFSTKSPFWAWLDRLNEAFKMSIYAMKAHKMRTLLTMLGIIIGIASVVSIVGLGQGSQAKILAEINALGTNTITVLDGYPADDPRRRFGRANLTIADAEAVASQPYALSVSPQVDVSTSIRYKNQDISGTVNGIGKDYLQVTGEKLAMGQGFDDTSIATSAQDIIIDQNAYKSYFNGEGNPVGQILQVGNIPARIVGVLGEQTSFFASTSNNPTVYMPYTTVMYRMLGKSTIDRFVVLVDEDTPSDIAETAIFDLLKTRHGTDDFDTFNLDSIKKTVQSTTNALTALISSIAIISLIVGGIGVMNIMLVSVTERTSEIGVRMAVGARQSDILGQFLIEAVLVCLLGGTLGIALAFGIGTLVNHFGGDSVGVVYSPLSIVVAFVCSTLIGVVFGFLPARNASKLNPVDALAHH